MPNELATIETKLDAIEKATEAYEVQIQQVAGHALRRTLLTARTLNAIRDALTDEVMREAVMPLQGRATGFLTDQDKEGGYELATVREVVLDALIHGARLTNNEINVISGRLYLAKNYFVRQIQESKEITNFQIHLGGVEQKGGHAYVDAIAAWVQAGELREIRKIRKKIDGAPFDERIAVRVNAGMGEDAIRGKAVRKLLAEVWKTATGITTDEPDTIDADAFVVDHGQHLLFDAEPWQDAAAEAQQAAPDADQVALIAEYERKLAECTDKAHVGPIAKQAGGDGRLTPEAKKTISGLCTARRKDL